MRIIVWGINYAPELTGIAPFNTGLCDYLREQGHQVEMVTTFPYYPFWKKIPGDRGLIYRTDDFDGVWVHRCWHYVPAHVTTLRRIWHELSFGITSFLRVLFLSRADVYVIVSPPLMLGPLASLMGWLKRRPYVFHVQDLQPDAAVGLGMMKVGRFTRLLYKVEAWSYNHAARVCGISQGMMDAFARKNVPEHKRVLFPNWLRSFGRNVSVEETEADRLRHATTFRKKFNIPDGVFLASYSGNLGRKQGLETLIDAAELLEARGREELSGIRYPLSVGHGPLGRPPSAVCPLPSDVRSPTRNNEEPVTSNPARPVLILIIGDGAMRPELETRVKELGLANVRMMPLLMEVDYRGMLEACAVSLILQAPGTGQYFFPSKLLSVLAARSPIVSVADADSELAKAVDEGKFGVNIAPAQPQELADVLTTLACDPDQVARLRENTRWVDRFAGPKVLSEFEARLKEIAR